MQKFFNNLIFGIIQDSSVSNNSHHPHFGEDGKLEPSWLHVNLYVLWKKLEEKVGSVAEVWRLGVPGKCWLHHKQDPHLQGTSQKAEICMMPAVMLLRNYGLCYRLIQ